MILSLCVSTRIPRIGLRQKGVFFGWVNLPISLRTTLLAEPSVGSILTPPKMRFGEGSINKIYRERVGVFPRPPLPTDSDSPRREIASESRGATDDGTRNISEDLAQGKDNHKRFVTEVRDAG